MNLSQRSLQSTWGDVNKMTENKIDPYLEHGEFKYKKKARGIMKALNPALPLTGCGALRTSSSLQNETVPR